MRGVTHPRVVNVKAKGAKWDVYAGRGRCPCGLAGCEHVRRGAWGNPFQLAQYGPEETMRRYFDWLDEPASTRVVAVRAALKGQVLGCWCKGRYPVCHAEALARLADGEALDAIRDDMLARLASPVVADKPQRDLFSDPDTRGT